MNDISVVDFYTNKKLDINIKGNETVFDLKCRFARSKNLDPAVYDKETVILCNGRIIDGKSLIKNQDIDNESILFVIRSIYTEDDRKGDNDTIEHVFALLNMVNNKRNMILRVLNTRKYMKKFLKLARGDYFIIRMLNNYEEFTEMDRNEFVQIGREHIQLNDISKLMIEILNRGNYSDLNEYVNKDEYNIDSLRNLESEDDMEDEDYDDDDGISSRSASPSTRPQYITNELFQQVIGSFLGGHNAQPTQDVYTPATNNMDVDDVVYEAPELEEQEIYLKLEVMRDYGITDMQRGREALIMFNGDIEQALAFLFENMDTN